MATSLLNPSGEDKRKNKNKPRLAFLISKLHTTSLHLLIQNMRNKQHVLAGDSSTIPSFLFFTNGPSQLDATNGSIRIRSNWLSSHEIAHPCLPRIPRRDEVWHEELRDFLFSGPFAQDALDAAWGQLS